MTINSSPKRSPVFGQIIIIVALMAIVAVVFIALGVFSSPSKIKHVTYKIQATGGYAVMVIKDNNHPNSTQTTVNTPWQETRLYNSGEQVFLEAANPSDTGSLSCEILIDNQAWKSQTVKSPTNKVACAGIVP